MVFRNKLNKIKLKNFFFKFSPAFTVLVKMIQMVANRVVVRLAALTTPYAIQTVASVTARPIWVVEPAIGR